MTRRLLPAAWTILAVALLLVPQSAWARTCDASISMETSSIAVGIGVTWGEGTIKYKGKRSSFSVNGISLIDAGIANVSSFGSVYNLRNLCDFDGTYAAAKGELALGGGMGGITMRNQNGVVINLQSSQAGLKLALGPEGVVIRLDDCSSQRG